MLEPEYDPGAVARSSPTQVDGRASLWVRLSLPRHLVGDRGGVTLPEEQEAEQVGDGIALCPTEVAVLRLAGSVAHVQQEEADPRRAQAIRLTLEHNSDEEELPRVHPCRLHGHPTHVYMRRLLVLRQDCILCLFTGVVDVRGRLYTVGVPR